MEKTQRTLLIFVLCLIFLVPSIALGKTMLHSYKELTIMSDLVVEGEVIKIKASGKVRDTFPFKLKGRISYATLKILRIIKGKSDSSTITVEFVQLNDFVDGAGLEEDCQGAQFPLGGKGIAYLKKLPNGHYSSPAGWCQGLK